MTDRTLPLPDEVTPEVVEAACFAWLRTLFPPKASDEEIRARITDNDRDHVRYILSAAIPAIRVKAPQ